MQELRVFRDVTALLAAVRRLAVGRTGVISIDGWDGSGKSSLARDVAAAIHCRYIDLDTYLHANSGGYVEHLRYDELGAHVTAIDSDVCVVEGVCVLDILQRIRVTPTLKIYVKLISAQETWPPDRWLDFGSADEAIADHRATMRLISLASRRAAEAPWDHLEEELITYHHAWHPHETADVYFERIE